MSLRFKVMSKSDRLTVGGRLIIRSGPQRSIPTSIAGIRFHSHMEAERFITLRELERGGEIVNLRRQVTYSLNVNGEHICNYIADFVYVDTETGQEIVEDVKGEREPVYRLKKRLMWAIHRIEIVEVK